MNLKHDTHALLRRLYIRASRVTLDSCPLLLVWMMCGERLATMRHVEFGAN